MTLIGTIITTAVAVCLLCIIIYFAFSEPKEIVMQDKEEITYRNWEAESSAVFKAFLDAVATSQMDKIRMLCEESTLQRISITTVEKPLAILHRDVIKNTAQEIEMEFISLTFKGHYLRDRVVFSKMPLLRIRSINESLR